MPVNQQEARPADVYVRLLGPVELRCGDKLICESRGRESLPWMLLKYLLVNRDREVDMAELDAVLWTTRGGESTSEGNARVRLSRLRKTLEPLGLDRRGGQSLIIYYSGRFSIIRSYDLAFDTDELLSLVRSERDLPLDDADAMPKCARALEVYRGEFLSCSAPAPWLDVYREQYAELFRALAARTLERIKTTGDETALDLLCSRSAELAPEDTELNDAIVAYLMERKMQIELVRHVSRRTAHRHPAYPAQ
ncbi:MAG: hypothetical protein LIO57_07235 [Oscillospiraceae bacterium]|nr:hypothetical protein [Oscillospiraceae bacterium]